MLLLLAASPTLALVAVDDVYFTDEDVALVVDAPGVLENDDDEGAPPLTVTGNGAAGNGSVSVAFDGSFTYTPAAGFFGDDTFEYTVEDGDGNSETATVTVTVEQVNDPVSEVPVAIDDDVIMNEDGVREIAVIIDAMANDELPAALTEIVDVGPSESEPTTILDPTGHPVTEPNSQAAIVACPDGDSANCIEYTPKPGYSGTDRFTYTIRSDGNESTATVTVHVRQVNTPPVVNRQSFSFSMVANTVLLVDVGQGLLYGVYDVDGDVGFTAQVTSFPAAGVLTWNTSDGSFAYTPPNNFTGSVSFEYQVSDGTDPSEVYRIDIEVTPAPAPPAPPPPGQVSIDHNLTQVPLEQSTSVTPNVLVMMDDSGSMDWNLSYDGTDENGGFILNNIPVASGNNRRSTSYYYLWGLPSNLFGNNTVNGRILPTHESMVSRYGNAAANHHQVWRARNASNNRLYYNPAVRYTPWVGQDQQNVEYSDATVTSVRLNPRNHSTASSNRINLTQNHTYTSTLVPRWSNTSTADSFSNTVYIPHYYTDAGVKVEIRNTAGVTYAGGPQRTDCANPLACTYAEEIQNFANFFQYYRTREYAAKNSLGRVISQVQDVRVGYDTINQSVSRNIADMNSLYTEGNKKALMDTIYGGSSNGGTPLRLSLQRAGRLFQGLGNYDPVLPAPEGFCQQNFTLLFSDGYWNGNNPSGIGNEDANSASPFDGGRYADGYSNTLADVAMYYYKRDLRSMENLVPASQRDIQGAPPGTFPSGAPRMHQHMKTYTVAFGVVGNVDPDTIPTDPATAFNWPSPTATPQGKIDDMLHAAINGRGQFLSAVNPQQLQTALESAFLEFTQAASSTSAAAFNSTSVQEDTLLYRGFYDLRNATGELTATEVSSSGVLAPAPTWRASEQLDGIAPNARVLVTYNPDTRSGIPFRPANLTADQLATMTPAQIEYIRGVRSNETQFTDGVLRQRPTMGGLLGDIVNSSPVFVGRPRSLNRDQSPFPIDDLYSEFARDNRDRRGVVYVGANDGILHGFDGSTGAEVFGYVPNKILDQSEHYRNLLNEFTDPFYQHKYYVDLTPRLNDVYMRASSGSVNKSWNTVLIGGLGAGGKGFFALNVNDPDTRFSSELNAAGAVLWEFTDSDDTSPLDGGGNVVLDPLGNPVKDLGYSLSLPTVAMTNVNDGGSPARKEWAAIFGNGPNSTAGIAKLFVLFMDRGLNGWGGTNAFVKLDTGYGVATSGPLAGLPNGLGSPAVVDTDLNGTADWVYAGDRQGNLFRFDIRDVNPNNWVVTRIFTATAANGTIQPILSQPLVVKHPTEQGFLVIFGTGSYMTRDDADSEDIQSIYGIWDRGADAPVTALPNTRAERLVEQTITNVVDPNNASVVRRIVSKHPVNYQLDDGAGPGTYGWYIDLDMPRANGALDTSGRAPPGPQFPGEKAIRQFIFRDGAVVTTTVLPSLSEFSCYGTRPGSILLFDAVSGGDVGRPVIDFNTDGTIDGSDLVDIFGDTFAGGLLFNQGDLDGALVDLSTLGGQGDTDYLFVSGGNDTVSYLIESVGDERTGRLSWRELELFN